MESEALSAYVVFIRERVHNDAEFAIYRQTAPAARVGHQLNPIAFYGPHEAWEGSNPEGVAIMEFPSMQAARDWYFSPAYQEARAHRQLGAEYRALLVEGVTS